MSNKEAAVAEIVAEMKQLPDDADWTCLAERRRFLAGLEKARADSRAGRVRTTEEMKAELDTWVRE